MVFMIVTLFCNFIDRCAGDEAGRGVYLELDDDRFLDLPNFELARKCGGLSNRRY